MNVIFPYRHVFGLRLICSILRLIVLLLLLVYWFWVHMLIMVLSLTFSVNFQKLAQLAIVGLPDLIFNDWSITCMDLITNHGLQILLVFSASMVLAELALDWFSSIEHFIFLTRVIWVPKLFMIMLTVSKTSSDYTHDILINARLLSRILFFCFILWVNRFKTFRCGFWRACYIFRIWFFLSLTFLIIWWLLCLLGWLFANSICWRFSNFTTILLRLIFVFRGLFTRCFAISRLFLHTARLCSKWRTACAFLSVR